MWLVGGAVSNPILELQFYRDERQDGHECAWALCGVSEEDQQVPQPKTRGEKEEEIQVCNPVRILSSQSVRSRFEFLSKISSIYFLILLSLLNQLLLQIYKYRSIYPSFLILSQAPIK